MEQPPGLVRRESAHDVDETVRRFRAAAQHAGLAIFADVDHGRGAAAAGLELRPTRLIVFGAARGGTPLMQIAQTVGIDLPLKVLVWQNAAGQTWIAYNDPQWIADRHGLGPAAAGAVAAMAQGLAALAATAAG
jgi:uncharacterized protein (DUF302 family)